MVVQDERGQRCRPWLTAWQDVRSRKIVAWAIYSHAPNSDPILSTFRQAVLQQGAPVSVIIDNGVGHCSGQKRRGGESNWLKSTISLHTYIYDLRPEITRIWRVSKMC